MSGAGASPRWGGSAGGLAGSTLPKRGLPRAPCVRARGRRGWPPRPPDTGLAEAEASWSRRRRTRRGDPSRLAIQVDLEADRDGVQAGVGGEVDVGADPARRPGDLLHGVPTGADREELSGVKTLGLAGALEAEPRVAAGVDRHVEEAAPPDPRAAGACEDPVARCPDAVVTDPRGGGRAVEAVGEDHGVAATGVGIILRGAGPGEAAVGGGRGAERGAPAVMASALAQSSLRRPPPPPRRWCAGRCGCRGRR